MPPGRASHYGGRAPQGPAHRHEPQPGSPQPAPSARVRTPKRRPPARGSFAFCRLGALHDFLFALRGASDRVGCSRPSRGFFVGGALRVSRRVACMHTRCVFAPRCTRAPVSLRAALARLSRSAPHSPACLRAGTRAQAFLPKSRLQAALCLAPRPSASTLSWTAARTASRSVYREVRRGPASAQVSRSSRARLARLRSNAPALRESRGVKRGLGSTGDASSQFAVTASDCAE